MEEKTNNGVEIRLTDLLLILKRCWILMLATLIVVMNLVSDILYKIVDPRINLE